MYLRNDVAGAKGWGQSGWMRLGKGPGARSICWTSFSLHVSWQKYLVTLVFRSGTSSSFDSHLPSFQQPIKSQVLGIPPTKQIQPHFRLSLSLACIPLCPTWTISSLILTSNRPDNSLQLTCPFHTVQPIDMVETIPVEKKNYWT